MYPCTEIYYADFITGILTIIKSYGHAGWVEASMSGKDITIFSETHSYNHYYAVLGVK